MKSKSIVLAFECTRVQLVDDDPLTAARQLVQNHGGEAVMEIRGDRIAVMLGWNGAVLHEVQHATEENIKAAFQALSSRSK